jgi:hypothetical protein
MVHDGCIHANTLQFRSQTLVYMRDPPLYIMFLGHDSGIPTASSLIYKCPIRAAFQGSFLRERLRVMGAKGPGVLRE